MAEYGFPILLLLVAVVWLVNTLSMRNKTDKYRMEIRRLKESLHQLQGQSQDAEQLDSILAAMNEAVFRLDKEGCLIAANARARKIFQLNNDGRSETLFSVYRDAEWQAQLQSAIAELPSSQSLKNMHVGKHVLAPRLAQLGNGEVLLFCMDVTEQFKLDKQRRTFLSNLMHDLKTPLTSLLGYARSLKSFADDESFRDEAVQVIADEAKHVNQLLDALLTLDQIEFAKRDADARCDAVAVLRQVSEMLSPQCAEKSLKIDLKAEGETLVAMDCDDLDRLVTNIIGNAVNYSPDGGTIHVALGVQDGRCHINVEDEGEGIPEKELPRVTERFYRVDKARSRQQGGHGLGLAIVKELLEQCQGELKLSNRSSNGLQAEIVIPLAGQASR